MKKILLSLSVLMLVACTAESDGLSRKDVEKIVADYIANNGAALTTSIDNYMAEKQKADAAAIVRDDNLVLENENATIDLVEFGNYRCPYCRRVQPTLAELHQKYPGKLKHVFKHMPIDPTSFDAALAVQAATEMGKGKEFFLAMWDESELVDATFERVAQKVGLDMEKFNKLRRSDATRAKIERDVQDAHSVGGSGTPFFVVNGQPLSGAQPLAQFENIVKGAL